MATLVNFVIHNILYNIVAHNVIHNSLTKVINDIMNDDTVNHNSSKKVINCLKTAQNCIIYDIMNNSLKGHSQYISKADYRTALLKNYHFDTQKKVKKMDNFSASS